MQEPIEPVEEEPIQQEPEALFWMFAVQLVYTIGDIERVRIVNIMATTYTPNITEYILGNVQQSAQIQAREHKKIPNKAKIIDVVILSFGLMGQMTQTEFRQRPVTNG